VNDQQEPLRSSRRRRLLVAGGVILALIAVGWTFRPRIDPRLVGKWVEFPGQRYECQWTFKDDGTLTVRTWSNRNGAMIDLPYRWFVFQGRFYKTPVLAPAASVEQALSSTLTHLWDVLTGRVVTPKVLINELTETSIVLRPILPGPPDDAQLIRLTRIPDDFVGFPGVDALKKNDQN
jgi:hypothetical protein